MQNHDAARRPNRLTLKSAEAAEAIAVSERTLWALTQPRGPIPAVRIGRSVRYRLVDLERFVESRLDGGADRASSRGACE